MALYKLSYTCVIFLLLVSPIQGKDKKENDGWCWSDYVVPILAATGAVVAAPVVLPALGFAAGGVAAGSAAAGVQSAVYGGAVASGSVFAGLQSAGAAGIAAGIGWAGNAAILSTAAGGATLFKITFLPCNLGPNCQSGFTAGGVAAGSIAAGAQSALYGGAVASGSVFAVLQSAGAAGVGLAGNATIVLVAPGEATLFKNTPSPCNGRPNCPSGFTTGGVAAGSIAASAQSALYGGAVASGSVFALLQSAGAAGVGLAGNEGIATAALGGSKMLQNTFSPCNGGLNCLSEFTASEVAAGFIAAGARSALFGEEVALGSVFSGLQSAGAAAVGLV
ncbi:interferon alpha-inducible protein 27-like protein 2B [Acropora millepora]|uniref:interferon alpha-inducible protein 27-like protein 2B n=1 Tax=Acropora millepora TaxID=45264 RepID=UPI001CF484EC|nr:interferon alpha-inducible protein 27-like protein 2B [Acropora millepora]